MKDTADNIAAKVQPEVYRLSFIVSTRPNLRFRVRSPRASKSVTKSPATREKTM